MTSDPRSSPGLPEDPRLPIAATLLDAAAVAPLLADLFGARVDRPRVRYLDYRPGCELSVHYDCWVADAVVEAYAEAGADGWHLHRYPDDPRLPLLAAGAAALGEAVGVRLDEVRRLAWVPGRRATLHGGSAIVKLYAPPTDAGRAATALELASEVIPCGTLLASDPALGAVVQAVVPGIACQREQAVALAPLAAQLARRLHCWASPDLPSFGPSELLAACQRPVELVGFAIEALTDRLAAACDALHATMPTGSAEGAVHGDFNIGQLLIDGTELRVVDVDTLALGPPGIDLGAYAANLHNGRPGDDAAVRAVMAALATKSPGDAGDLRWYVAATMLRRIDRPLRRLKKAWPERVACTLSAIEQLLG